MFGCRTVDPLLAAILLEGTRSPEPINTLSPNAKQRIDVATQTNQQPHNSPTAAVVATATIQPPSLVQQQQQLQPLKLDDAISVGVSVNETSLSCMSNASTTSAAGSLDDTSALDSILALGLEMEQRAAAAKVEATAAVGLASTPTDIQIDTQQQQAGTQLVVTTDIATLAYSNAFHFGHSYSTPAPYASAALPPHHQQQQHQHHHLHRSHLEPQLSDTTHPHHHHHAAARLPHHHHHNHHFHAVATRQTASASYADFYAAAAASVGAAGVDVNNSSIINENVSPASVAAVGGGDFNFA